MRPGIVHRIDADTSGLLVIAKNNSAHIKLQHQFKLHSTTRRYWAIVMNDIGYNLGVIESMIARHPSMPSKRVATMLKHYLPDAEFNLNNTNQNSNDFFDSVQQHKKGKFARTHYKVLERFTVDSLDVIPSSRMVQYHNKWFHFTLIECQLETGRTHQIRVHMSSIGKPLLGDRLYGPKTPKKPTLDSMVVDSILGVQFNPRNNHHHAKKSEADANVLNGGQLLHAAVLGFVHPVTETPLEFTAKLPEHFEQVLKRLRDATRAHEKRQEEESDSMGY